MQKKNYQEEILNLIHSGLPQAELAEKLSDYHENDLADALTALTPDERQKLYPVLGIERVAEIFSYLDDAEPYLKELPSEKAAKVVSNMDSDDAVDALDDLEEEDKAKIVGQLDRDSAEDVRMLLSYGEDEIGSSMTTNYISIRKDMTIRQAMSELVKQAGENDNISTLYVVDENDKFYGAIDLKDLIIARADDRLEKLIARSYPYVTDHEKISDCIDRIVDYAERSLPVLNDAGKLVGIITSSDVVELVDDEMGDDYAKLGGLTSEEDLNEGVFESVKKRLPWLIALLFLGMLVSSVVGAFESVVAVLPIVICFQSMVHPVAGRDHPCAGGREPDHRQKASAALEGDAGRSGERRTAGCDGAGLPGLLHPFLQGVCLGRSLPAVRLCRRGADHRYGRFQPGGHGHPHAVPQDPHRPRCGLRPTHHHHQRSGGRRGLLRPCHGRSH